MDIIKPAEQTAPAELSPEQQKRASDIAAVKAAITPLKELETVSIRPCCNDVIFAYKPIEGVGRRCLLCVHLGTGSP